MMPAFHDFEGKEISISRSRRSAATPPLWTDGGRNGAMTMGLHQAQWTENPKGIRTTKG